MNSFRLFAFGIVRGWRQGVGTVLVVVLMAVPAFAGVETGDVVVQGTATVGDSIGGGPIPQSGVCHPTGKGLHAPGFHGSGKNKSKGTPVVVNKEVYYNLSTIVPAVITDTNDLAASGLYEGILNICGIVSPGPGGIGAACGSSMGRDGKGKLNLLAGPAAPRFYDLQDIAWPPALGGVLLVYGHITRVSADKVSKFSSKGTFEGEVTATGGSPCIEAKPGGARAFSLFGSVATEMLGKPAPKAREPKLEK